MSNVIVLRDKEPIRDHLSVEEKKIVNEKMSAGPSRTLITITDHDTGEVLFEGHNKVVITGGQFTACTQWGLDPVVPFPNYNDVLGLENTLDYEKVQPKNDPIICLFGVGNGGAGGSKYTDVYPVRYTERINPENLLPFRYVDQTHDLNEDQRKVYFGRKQLEDADRIAYYFKKFDTEPQLHLRYLDGTQLTEDMYEIDAKQSAECYVETRLRVTRQDFRDYFEQVLGWDKAEINTLSLLYAWYDDDLDTYRYYQQIFPATKLNFPTIMLQDLNKAVDFNYQVFY